MPRRNAVQWLSSRQEAGRSSAQIRSNLLSRRQLLRFFGKAAVAGSALDLCGLARGGARGSKLAPAISEDPTYTHVMEQMERAGFRFFWEQANPATGLVKDRARGMGADTRTLGSIASTGFGLTALCIGDSRHYQPAERIKERVMTTLNFLRSRGPDKHGFFYHYMDVTTGERTGGSEVSPIDTAILLCGVLTCKEYFHDAQIARLAAEIYERVEWPWMLHGGATFSQGWTPEHGFFELRWDTYCELMMLYLLAMGSRTHPIPASSWNAWARPKMHYHGLTFIAADAPLFAHQFSHAWFDFRAKHDAFANYFENSVTATQAHKLFCLTLAGRFPDYSEKLWGISSSDSAHGYVAWGGPPPMGPIDGTVVPSAAAGSIAFLPKDTLAVLENIHEHYGANGGWTRYGFTDAFNPLTHWYDTDVVGIGLGISLLMAENYRTQLVWNTFMKNAEVKTAMRAAGFRPDVESSSSEAAGYDLR